MEGRSVAKSEVVHFELEGSPCEYNWLNHTQKLFDGRRSHGKYDSFEDTEWSFFHFEACRRGGAWDCSEREMSFVDEESWYKVIVVFDDEIIKIALRGWEEVSLGS